MHFKPFLLGKTFQDWERDDLVANNGGDMKQCPSRSSCAWSCIFGIAIPITARGWPPLRIFPRETPCPRGDAAILGSFLW